jgi:hypothetical protein
MDKVIKILKETNACPECDKWDSCTEYYLECEVYEKHPHIFALTQAQSAQKVIEAVGEYIQFVQCQELGPHGEGHWDFFSEMSKAYAEHKQ